LKCISEAWLGQFGRDLSTDFVAGVLPHISLAIWSGWRGQKDDPEAFAELESLVNASPAALAGSARAVVEDVAPDEPAAVRSALEAYVRQVPATIRRYLRRPSDPAGKSLPQGLRFGRAEEFMPLLPLRLSAYESGDTPLPDADWELEELLGAGRLGEVWLARAVGRSFSRSAALKFFRDPVSAKVLRSEARLLDRVILEGKHAGIVPLRQTYLGLDKPCLVYQYVPGSDLVGLLRDWQRRGRGPSQEQLANVIRRLAAVVAFAHQLEPPLVHRNLKPANILVVQSGEGRISFRISDYGSGGVAASHAMRSALRGDTDNATALSALRGENTLLYISPQQLAGQDADPRDDIYSLGVIWFQLVYGDVSLSRPTEEGWRQRLQVLGMPESYVELLSDCLARNPDDRPRNGAELAARLDALLRTPTDEASVSAATADRDGRGSSLARRLTNGVGMTLVLIPPGTYRMGSPSTESLRGNDEGPQHEVTLTESFYMSIYPVTQRQFMTVMSYNPSFFTEVRGGSPEFPAESVTWDEANEFCRKLSDTPAEKAAGRVYRLPTEAEWEYACRGGMAMPFSSGATLSSREANFNGNYPYGIVARGPYKEMTTKVGSYSPNPFGLFDMHGNVWEWCADFYERNYYKNSPRFNPGGPGEGELRIVRGGSCFNIGQFCRSAYRFGISPGNRDRDVGMRVVMVTQNGAGSVSESEA
jgi:formylglycine-generating enzyme required for sulfatase activity